jgi:glycogen(starch) synthase
MNILIFSTVFFPAVGGVENQTLLLINEFVKKGHSVKVVTFQKQRTTLQDIDIHYSPSYFSFAASFIWCDVIYMPNISLKGLWLFLFNPGKRWVISHNDYSFFNKKGVLAKLKALSLTFATKNIAVSKSIAKNLKTPSLVIPNCYDESIFRIYPDEQRQFDFVFLGRLVTQKGCELLLQACKRLNRPFTLNIIGVGVEKSNLEKLTEDLGLSNNVTFLGLLVKEELARMLNRHAIMIIPSIEEEGFGMVALEGMACGCKIIAANAGGLADAVNGFGKKFEMGDLDGLTTLLNEGLDDTSTFMTREVIAYLELHHRHSVANNYLQAFN